MTHYTVDYSTITDAKAKQERALDDIKEYRGEVWFRKMTDEFQLHTDMTLEKFANYLSIAGISGYPVEAWFNHIYGA